MKMVSICWIYVWKGDCFSANTFQNRMIHRYVWRRDERSEQKSIIDYIPADEKLRSDVLDGMVVKGMFDRSYHYAVLAKIRDRWEYGRHGDNANVREVKEVREEYKRKSI